MRIRQIDVLRALAIFAVIIIHSLSIAIAPFLKEKPQIFYILGTDQIMRFCVPFFIAVSGYLLAAKYLDTKIPIGDFLKKRALSLLPAYLFWSAIIYVYLKYFTQEPKNSYNFLQIILLGRADYHLYFVPVLFYLYLLFPLLIYFYRRSKITTMAAAFVLQFGFILFSNLVAAKTAKLPFLWGDQQQYVFPLSWIFYFILGIFLGSLNTDKYNKVLKISSLALLLPTLAFVVIDSISIFTKTENYIESTTFTRIPILIYASLATTAFILWQGKILKISFLSKIGRKSYSIYLFHTLVIRILYGYFQPKDIPALVWFTFLAISISTLTAFILGKIHATLKRLLPASWKLFPQA